MKLEVIRPKIFKRNAIRAYFTLKNSGMIDNDRNIDGLNLGFNTNEIPETITKNRQTLLKAFHIDPDWIGFADQVHSNNVKVITSGSTFSETDGLITQVPGLALAIQVADCAAVLIADTKSKTIAAIHAGWRGAAGDIIPRSLEKMNQLGVNTMNCKAFISPCISVDNFEVGTEVAEQFPDEFVEYQRYDKPHLNLKKFLAYQLRQGGLQSSVIQIHPACTVENKQFYSYRREKSESGRMMGIIQMQ